MTVLCSVCYGLEDIRCPYCVDGVNRSGTACRECNGRGWIMCRHCNGTGGEPVDHKAERRKMLVDTLHKQARQTAYSVPSELNYRSWDAEARSFIHRLRDKLNADYWHDND